METKHWYYLIGMGVGILLGIVAVSMLNYDDVHMDKENFGDLVTMLTDCWAKEQNLQWNGSQFTWDDPACPEGHWLLDNEVCVEYGTPIILHAYDSERGD